MLTWNKVHKWIWARHLAKNRQRKTMPKSHGTQNDPSTPIQQLAPSGAMETKWKNWNVRNWQLAMQKLTIFTTTTIQDQQPSKRANCRWTRTFRRHSNCWTEVKRIKMLDTAKNNFENVPFQTLKTKRWKTTKRTLKCWLHNTNTTSLHCRHEIWWHKLTLDES